MEDLLRISFETYLGLKLGKWVAEIQCKWAPLVYGEFLAKLTSLILAVQNVKVIWSLRIFNMFWLIPRIHSKSNDILLHFGHHFLNILIWHAQVRISVDLDEPHPKVFIYEKIKAEQLEAILSVVRIQLLSNTEECINYDVLHSLNKMFFNIYIMLFKLLIQVFLKLIIAKSVSFFMGSICFKLVLETLISKMHRCAFRRR